MSPLLRRIAGRFVAGLGVLWGAATATFLIINLTGGDTALAILGASEANPSPEILARIRADYHLDQPLFQQYLHYLGNLMRGDLGESYRLRIPVAQAIGQQLEPTVILAFWAALTAVVLSIGIALLTARRRPLVRRTADLAELVLSSMPGFVVGILLLIVFAFQLQWLPAFGNEGWLSLVLPVVTLATPMGAMLTQILRRELEEVLEQPFIITARSRGLSDAGVRLGHALRHALIPVVTLSGAFFGMLLGGAVIAETLFARQGVGRLVAEATTNKDVPLVLGVTVLSAATYVVINFIVDLFTAVIDPRIRNT